MRIWVVEAESVEFDRYVMGLVFVWWCFLMVVCCVVFCFFFRFVGWFLGGFFVFRVVVCVSFVRRFGIDRYVVVGVLRLGEVGR